MIILGQAIILTMQHFLEDIIMSILNAIVQAILQSIAWVLPISESGHSSMFHDFASRQTGANSTITGVIYIGIAVGIIIAMYKLFLKLSVQFAGTFKDMFKKQLKGSNKRPIRAFMYMTLVAFVPMVLWAIPTGHGLIYTVLHRTSFNNTLLDDGIFFVVTGLLLLFVNKKLTKGYEEKTVTILPAVVVGMLSVFFVPVSGLSLIAGVFCVLVLFGVSKSLAYKFSFVVSAPVLVVMGIVEMCTATVFANWISIILALVISVLFSFLAVKVLIYVIKKLYLNYFGIYDIAVGIIIAIVGIFEIVLR